MANETTPSTYSTRSLSYVLAQEALPANLPILVFHALANDIDIAGESTGVAQLPVHSDLGPASPGTYGTAVTTNVAMSHDSAIQLTVVEGAIARGLVLDEAIARKFPGMRDVEMLMQVGTFDQKKAALQEEINRLTSMCLETYEDDHCNLTTGFSNSVGTSGVALTVDDLLTAIYTYETLEGITQETAWAMWGIQTYHLTKDLAVNGGGLGGGAWVQNIDVSFLKSAGLPTNGYKGSFMGRPWYQGAHSLRTLSDTNANVNGMLVAVGRGNPMKPGYQLGGIAHARSGWIKVRLEYSAQDRGMIVIVSIEYVAAEVRDAHGVRIKTKATA